MTEPRRKTFAAIALFLGLAVLVFILLLSAVHAVGTDGALYYAEQTRANVLPEAGISETDLRALDDGLSRVLAGQENDLLLPMDSAPGAYSVLPVEVFGQLQPAFNEKEVTHLIDCANLFALLRKVLRRLIPWAVLLITLGAYLLRDRRRIRRIAWLSPLLILIPLGAFAIWATADFDSAFNAFHRLLFTNDLWLLDPRTDLLIRICPGSMFAHMGLRIGIYALVGMLAVPAVATLLTYVWPKGKGENTWKTTTPRGAAPKQMGFAKREKR